MNAYEALAELTARMLAAAKRDEWDELVELEIQYRNMAEKIRDDNEAVSGHKIALLKKILADEEEIRKLTGERMSHVKSILQSNKQEQRLNQAYGAM